MARTLNLGILAHVDAGKTTLTERLLHAAGVIDEVGSVDRGTTHTDTLALERQRGITIRSAVVSFTLGDVTVNLVDTPGHSDFIAEVERALAVLDGAVLVVSAVEGVQAQTRVLMRVLQRLRIPRVVFVNKVDRAGARPEAVLAEIADRLTPDVVAMGEVVDAGTRAARVECAPDTDPATCDRLAEVLTRHDDRLLAAWLDGDGDGVAPARLRAALAEQTAAVRVHPVLFGSAATGAGVAELMAALTALLPTAGGDPDGPASGTVFKVERGPAGERLAWVRLFSGTVRVRDRLPVGGADARVTGIRLSENGDEVPAHELAAGRVGVLSGLTGVRVGDAIGMPWEAAARAHQFSPPSLETVVEACDARRRGALHAALTELCEQDPMVGLRQDDVRRELSVSLYGEVQKEVLAATLADEYGVRVAFRETTPLCIERVLGPGAAFELIDVHPNPFLATVGLAVAPAPVGHGVDVRLGVELGSMPAAFFTAVEGAVRETLLQGLHGWAVPDAVVTVTHSGYWARQSHAHGTFDASMSSTAGDFRLLTPLVLATALRRAGTQVCEPVHRFEVEVPDDALNAVLALLSRTQAVPLETQVRGTAYLLSGLVPAARVHQLRQQLPGVSRGEGVLVDAFDHHEPVRGPAPERARTDLNPLDRREYLRVARGR
ncbi:translation factor GTPase family protein [Oryzihumus sp.]|uniref:translation factor GTPase family protein n=1 Tax=Oryzihumus sp. TaxID=1968903 RepID=UPI002ED8CA57